jgi:hypothetical protein
MGISERRFKKLDAKIRVKHHKSTPSVLHSQGRSFTPGSATVSQGRNVQKQDMPEGSNQPLASFGESHARPAGLNA